MITPAILPALNRFFALRYLVSGDDVFVALISKMIRLFSLSVSVFMRVYCSVIFNVSKVPESIFMTLPNFSCGIGARSFSMVSQGKSVGKWM